MAKRGAHPSMSTRSSPPEELIKMSTLAHRSGVPAPTIKHYIREGLLPGPAVRTSRNMAFYDPRMVDRIRAIKALQSQHFFPLNVIGELLEPAPSAALRSDPSSQQRMLQTLVPILTPDRRERRRSQTDLIRTEGVTRDELAQLEAAGLIERHGEGASAGYGGPDVDIIELVGELRRQGLGELFPISLAGAYRDAVERLVAFEIELFSRRVLGAELPAPLGEVAQLAVRIGERLVVALRARMLPTLLVKSGNAPAVPTPRRPRSRPRARKA